LERVVEDHAEAGARELLDVARREARGFLDDVERQAGVVPPIGRDAGSAEVHLRVGRYLLPSASRSGSSASAPKPKCRCRVQPSACWNFFVRLPSASEKLSIVLR